MSEKLAYNLTEAAAALGVSRPTIYKLIHTAGFPVISIGTRKLVPVDALRLWVMDQCGGNDG